MDAVFDFVCVYMCVSPPHGGECDKERERLQRVFSKVGLATNSCMKVCVGVFMKTHALKCVCKCVCVCPGNVSMFLIM